MKNNHTHTQILSIICSVFDAYSATLFLPKEGGNGCELVAAFSLGDSIAWGAQSAPDKGLVGWIYRNKQPIVLPNFEQRHNKLGYYENDEESKIKAFMGCPISTGGVLCVDSKRQYSFSDKDSKILQMFASLTSKIGTGLNAETLVGDIPNYFTQLGILQGLRFRYKRWPLFVKNFLHMLAGATHYDYCAFASMDTSGDSYTLESESVPLLLGAGQQLRIPLSNGIAGWVLRDDGQAVFSEGLSNSVTSASLFGKIQDMPIFQAVICVPILVNRSASGVLCLAHSQPREMDEALRSFVYQCVEHLSLFLENLYLKSRLRELLPQAHIHNHGSTVYDPDSNPQTYFEEA